MTGQAMIGLVEDIGKKIEEITKELAEKLVDYIREQRAKKKREEVI